MPKFQLVHLSNMTNFFFGYVISSKKGGLSAVEFYFFCIKTLNIRKKEIKWFQILSIIIIFAIKVYFSAMFSALINFTITIFLHLAILLLFKDLLSKKILLMVLYLCFSVLPEEIGMIIM